MKELLGHGLLHGDCLTVTGQTVAENLAAVPSLKDLGVQVTKFCIAWCLYVLGVQTCWCCVQDVIYPVSAPVAPPDRHVLILKV